MIALKYDDLTDSSTLTSKLFEKRQKEIELAEAKLERMKAFDVAITNYLQNHGEVGFNFYNEACVLLYHSNKTVSEILREAENGGW